MPGLRSVERLIVAISLTMSHGSLAIAADPGERPAKTSASTASFSHSGLKTFTYEIGNTLNNFLFLSAGAGTVVGGGMLTAFNTLQSWTIYTTNDYLWEKFHPREKSLDGSFDSKESVWRSTLKYMTGKPIVASVKIAAIYLYTGSAVTAFTYGTAATVGASVVFFLNNTAWDYYDHSIATPMATAAAR